MLGPGERSRIEGYLAQNHDPKMPPGSLRGGKVESNAEGKPSLNYRVIPSFINRNDMSVQAGTDRYGDRDTDPAPHQEHEAGPEAAGVVRDDARPARADPVLR